MASDGLRSRRVMAGSVNTHYTEAGDNGPIIVALHGGGAGSSGESGMGLVMPLLAPDFRVIAPELDRWVWRYGSIRSGSLWPDQPHYPARGLRRYDVPR